VANRLEISRTFYAVEADLYRNGREAFIAYMARSLSYRLDEKGGLRPYEFYCKGGDGNLAPHTMFAREL
jgi:hypothetical protein